MRNIVFLTAALFIIAAYTGSAQAATATLEGTITKVSGKTLALTAADGSLKTVSLQADTLILARQPVTLEAIKPKDALGVAARRQSDGSLTASGINIFSPELWDRVRKGQFPMQTGEVMTNALVSKYAVGVQGRVLYLEYAGGTAAIDVPEGTRINSLITKRASDLKPGMHVVVRGEMKPEGGVAASTVTIDLPAQG
jgi:hypothetical protein